MTVPVVLWPIACPASAPMPAPTRVPAWASLQPANDPATRRTAGTSTRRISWKRRIGRLLNLSPSRDTAPVRGIPRLPRAVRAGRRRAVVVLVPVIVILGVDRCSDAGADQGTRDGGFAALAQDRPEPAAQERPFQGAAPAQAQERAGQERGDPRSLDPGRRCPVSVHTISGALMPRGG